MRACIFDQSKQKVIELVSTPFEAAAVVIPHKKLKSDGSSHQSDSAGSGPNGGENGNSMGGTKHLYSVAIDSVPNHEASMALTNAQLRCGGGGVPVNAATDLPGLDTNSIFSVSFL